MPETQIIASTQEHILAHGHDEYSQKDFEDCMIQFEHGSRRRYRNSAPSLHVNSTPQTHNPLDGNLRVERERGRRVSFMSSTSLEHQNPSLNNFNRRGEDDNFMGGARRASLRSSAFAEYQHPSQSNPSSRSEDDNPIGGSRINVRVALNHQKVPCSRIRRNQPKKIGNWTNAQLKAALDAITDDGMKVREASRTFGILPLSSRDHFYGRVQGRKRGAKTILKDDEEKTLLEYLFKMQNLGHPLIPGQLRLKVAQATQTRETPWSATWVPGKSWLRSFKQRHPELVNRKNQPLELVRARGLCPSAAANFYCNLKELYDTWNYPPSHIWNCDESEV